MTEATPADSTNRPAPVAPEVRMQIALALLDDANGWAQHFSNVRLAVVTFLSGICLGIMNFKWDHPEAFVVWSTLGIWLLGLTLFVIFSMAEWRKLDQRDRNIGEIMALLGKERRSERLPPREGIERLTCEWRRQKDWAFGAYLLFTAIFLVAWCEWSQRIAAATEASQAATTSTSDEPEAGAATATD